MADKDKYSTFEKLLIDLITDEEFDKLQNLSRGVNIYKVTGMKKQEIKHSNTIAWFLNPFESHNLGLLFFRKFMTQLFEEKHSYFYDQKINILELLLSDLDDIEVIREREKNIDLLLKSEKSKFIICIENKILAGIGKGQLDKYYDYVLEKYDSYSKKIFILLSPSGYEVPDEKSKCKEKWTSFSYERIVNIFRSMLKLDIEHKIQYIIEDYIELLEQEHIVENTELDSILARLCTKHKEAINLLVEYQQSQSGLKHIQEVFVRTLLELEKEDKIICNKSSMSKYFLVFYTKNMNAYLPPLNDKSGSYQEGSKYRYWIYLKNKTDGPRIVFELGPLGQDQDTINKFNKIRKFVKKKEITNADKFSQTNNWDIDLDLSADDLDEKNMRQQIIETIKEILEWEEKLGEIIK